MVQSMRMPVHISMACRRTVHTFLYMSVHMSYACPYTGQIIAVVFWSCGWLGMFKNFREDTLRLRRGLYKDVGIDRSRPLPGPVLEVD